jgi:hypothetical protein
MQTKFLIALLALSVQGCALVGSSIPDETRVVDGPSLSLPPDFELKPPSELSKKDNSYKAAEKAQGVLLGAKEPTTVNAGEASWLLNKAGQADEDIREQLEAEEAALEETKKTGWFNKMWGADTEVEEEAEETKMVETKKVEEVLTEEPDTPEVETE